MTRDRGPRRLRRLEPNAGRGAERSTRRGAGPGTRRSALLAASVTALSLTASGCVVVHGEREVLPAATKGEAAKAMTSFLTAYNKAQRANDRALDAGRVAGALADIDGAKLRAGHRTAPDGNSSYKALELTDTTYTIPKKAGWPRWFVADSASNRGSGRWLLVFTRAGADDAWRVSYLTVVAADDVPVFEKDDDGFAEPVTAGDPALSVAPGRLATAYADYLQDSGDGFAPGAFTSALRDTRKKNATRPGLARQYRDEALSGGAYTPLGLRTKDGSALVFFATRHYEKQTAAKGVRLTVTDPAIKALMNGEPQQSLTLAYVSNQAVLDPAKSGPGGDGDGDRDGVAFLGRVAGLTGAKGE